MFDSRQGRQYLEHEGGYNERRLGRIRVSDGSDGFGYHLNMTAERHSESTIYPSLRFANGPKR